jgi:protein tyrosine phosphatase (PTP) superfamily phosphohydrolase (DUF442 family)
MLFCVRVFGSVAIVSFLLLGCSRQNGIAPPPSDPSGSELGSVEAKGLPNVYRLSEKLYSGGSPEGDEGFASLRNLGIKTVISVDGARPDVEAARRHELRYVHLPIGYDGIPREQALRIAKAVRDLPGPIYVHCHHGKHRGPAAAAVARLCLDDRCGVDAVLEDMRRAGTDPHYTGLYAAPRDFQRPTEEDLKQVPGEFPEVAEVPALAEVMVNVDERWEHLKLVREAGWKTPSCHPDLDPPHEALQLFELYNEAARMLEVRDRPEEFRIWLTEARDRANNLEKSLGVSRDGGEINVKAAEEAFRAVNDTCVRCHSKYRDTPRKPG